MRMPMGDRAIVELEKLTEYCLSQTHSRGKHKARVFAAALGVTAAEATRLRAALLEAAANGEAVPYQGDDYGRRYVIDLKMSGLRGLRVVRSTWIIKRNEETPRLTSCYVV